jgi:RNA-directed DNA polymerase
MHDELSSQQEGLAKKLRGHYEYYGITGNSEALHRFAWEVVAVWRKWLDRRSQNAKMTWERMHRLLKRYPLPRPRITHPLPARS